MRNEDGFITNHLPYAIVAKKEHAVTKKPTFSHFSFLISHFLFPMPYALEYNHNPRQNKESKHGKSTKPETPGREKINKRKTDNDKRKLPTDGETGYHRRDEPGDTVLRQ